MNDSVTVIDIVAQVTDETSSGARSAEANVSKLERSMMNLQKQIMGMKGKSKLEVKATLKDMARKGLDGNAESGRPCHRPLQKNCKPDSKPDDADGGVCRGFLRRGGHHQHV